jgi:hypothetical protein
MGQGAANIIVINNRSEGKIKAIPVKILAEQIERNPLMVSYNGIKIDPSLNEKVIKNDLEPWLQAKIRVDTLLAGIHK